MLDDFQVMDLQKEHRLLDPPLSDFPSVKFYLDIQQGAISADKSFPALPLKAFYKVGEGDETLDWHGDSDASVSFLRKIYFRYRDRPYSLWSSARPNAQPPPGVSIEKGQSVYWCGTDLRFTITAEPDHESFKLTIFQGVDAFNFLDLSYDALLHRLDSFARYRMLERIAPAFSQLFNVSVESMWIRKSPPEEKVFERFLNVGISEAYQLVIDERMMYVDDGNIRFREIEFRITNSENFPIFFRHYLMSRDCTVSKLDKNSIMVPPRQSIISRCDITTHVIRALENDINLQYKIFISRNPVTFKIE